MSTKQDDTLIISDTPTALSGVPTHSGAERRTLMSVDAIDMNATYKYSIKRETNSLVYIWVHSCFDFLKNRGIVCWTAKVTIWQLLSYNRNPCQSVSVEKGNIDNVTSNKLSKSSNFILPTRGHAFSWNCERATAKHDKQAVITSRRLCSCAFLFKALIKRHLKEFLGQRQRGSKGKRWLCLSKRHFGLQLNKHFMFYEPLQQGQQADDTGSRPVGQWPHGKSSV